MIKRDILQPIIEHLAEKEITVIVGPRQVGKTTILDQVEKYLLQKKQAAPANIFRFNLDVISDLDFFQKQDDVIAFIKSRKKKNEIMYFFIDEVQRIKNAGIFIKGIYDLNLGVKFILTGSSSLEIKTKVQEALTGRKKVFQVMPLSINEYLRYIDEQLFDIVHKEEKIIDYDLAKLMKIMNDFVVFGGYPRVATEENIDKKISILEELYTSYLDKDVTNFLKIKKITAFNKLVSLLSAQAGGLLNVDHLSSDVGIEVKTVNEYLNALANTFVVSLVYPFFTNRKKELVKTPKIYFVDTGLRNFAIGRFENLDKREDKGVLFENAVATELLKSIKIPMTLHYWRTLQKAELDFVLRSGNGELTAIEVNPVREQSSFALLENLFLTRRAVYADGDVKPPLRAFSNGVKTKKMKDLAISRSYHSFLNKYSPQKALLVNLNLRQQMKIKDRKVKACTIFDVKSEINNK